MSLLCRIIFIIVMIALLLLACVGLAVVASADEKIRVGYNVCDTEIDGFRVIWSESHKLPFTDVKTDTPCWEWYGFIDQWTVEYYSFIGAALELRPRQGLVQPMPVMKERRK